MSFGTLKHKYHDLMLKGNDQKNSIKRSGKKANRTTYEKKKLAAYHKERRAKLKKEHDELIALREKKEEFANRLEEERRQNKIDSILNAEPYCKITKSEKFREAFFDLYGETWEEYVSADPFAIENLTLTLAIFLEAFRLKKQFGKYFDFSKVRELHFDSYFNNSFDADEFLAVCVHAKAISMANFENLPPSKRRSVKKAFATPSWRDRDAIKSVYDERAKRSEEEGMMFHVDHVIPIQGRHVCGLHVHNNLAIILAKDNMSKGNKFIVESS